MSSREWKEVELKKIIDLVIDYRGKTPKKLGGDWSNEGYRALSAKNIKTGEIVREDSIRYLNHDLYSKWMKEEINRGDIIMTSEAPFGELFHWNSDEKIVLSQRLFGLRTSNKVDSEYLYHYMTTRKFQKELDARATGTTVRGLRQPQLLKCKVKIPPLQEQKSIAHILSNLDAKIEVNNKINKTIEEMAQAIFKHWFVDFEFPNEDGEPYKSSGGEMVESELGLIPKGWQVINLGEIISLSSGKRPRQKLSEASSEFEIPLVGASSIMSYTNEFNYNESVLVIGRVGTHGVVQRYNDRIWASDNTLVIKSKYYEYVYQILNSIDYSAINRGSTQPLITQTDIKKHKVLKPREGLFEKFENLVGKNNRLQLVNQKQNSVLESIKNTLLPKLMSGEIRVPLDTDEQ